MQKGSVANNVNSKEGCVKIKRLLYPTRKDYEEYLEKQKIRGYIRLLMAIKNR